jgi:hypothetical protein
MVRRGKKQQEQDYVEYNEDKPRKIKPQPVPTRVPPDIKREIVDLAAEYDWSMAYVSSQLMQLGLKTFKSKRLRFPVV